MYFFLYSVIIGLFVYYVYIYVLSHDALYRYLCTSVDKRQTDFTSCWVNIFFNLFSILFKKSLKIPKGKSESVYRRRTDNTMTKRKSTNNDLQNIHIKLKIE